MRSAATSDASDDWHVLIFGTEILILGTGKTVSLPPPSIKSYLNSLGIQLDIMDTVRLCIPIAHAKSLILMETRVLVECMYDL